MPSDWDATLRPTRIPTTAGAAGSDGQAIFSARQSRLGLRASVPAGSYDLKTRLEIDFFGRGSGAPQNSGQNTVRLRRAYGEWGPILGGLTASLFMDDNWYPSCVDYFCVNGRTLLRNVQIRYTFLTGKHGLAVALEKPGADVPDYPSPDIDLATDNKLPDLTAQYRFAQPWGHVQVSGVVRRLGFDTPGTPDNQPKGSTVGWGANVSSVIKVVPDTFHLFLAAMYGMGVQSYIQDATPDLGSGSSTTIDPEAVPVLGTAAYADVYWNELLSSTLGYSNVKNWTRNGQGASVFEMGQYASANVLARPVRNLLLGPEFIWGRRNDKGGASGNDYRLQISLRFSFSSLDFWKPS
jgi:hypothetical protein